eukprot:Lithocolla_globosa_v1_NODE_1017_length_2950_cov_54.732735.p2 type:complete len:193 gc:universal NODE_1017_length_2950_cov_54.732735:2394-1816(-)
MAHLIRAIRTIPEVVTLPGRCDARGAVSADKGVFGQARVTVRLIRPIFTLRVPVAIKVPTDTSNFSRSTLETRAALAVVTLRPFVRAIQTVVDEVAIPRQNHAVPVVAREVVQSTRQVAAQTLDGLVQLHASIAVIAGDFSIARWHLIFVPQGAVLRLLVNNRLIQGEAVTVEISPKAGITLVIVGGAVTVL